MAYVSQPSVFYYKSKWQDNAFRADIQIIYQMYIEWKWTKGSFLRWKSYAISCL